MRSSTYQPAGSVLICVLACLLIVSGLAVAMVRSALAARKAVRLERQQAQVQFLLEAGIQRAVASLARDAAYSGQNWELPAGTLPGLDPARVDIAVTTIGAERSPTVSIVAQLPADSPLSVRRSYTFTVSNEE